MVDPLTSNTSTIERFFDKMAGERNAIFRSNPVLDYEQRVRSSTVIGLLNAKIGETILDVGCGNARDIKQIVGSGATVVGVDLSHEMINEAMREFTEAESVNVQLEIGDVTMLRFPAESFDKILCSEVIEHVPDLERAISEMYRVLKPGGYLVVSSPNRHSWYGFDRFVIWSKILRRKWDHPFDDWKSIREVHALLERHGFGVVGSTTACYLPGFVLTYKLPTWLQRVVVRCTEAADPIVSWAFPRAGYMLACSVKK